MSSNKVQKRKRRRK